MRYLGYCISVIQRELWSHTCLSQLMRLPYNQCAYFSVQLYILKNITKTIAAILYKHYSKKFITYYISLFSNHFTYVRCFLGGDLRLNENGGRAALQTMLVRHHNRVAAELASINTHWGDHTLFEMARAIVGASLQHITYTEFLPTLLGMQVAIAFITF